MAKKKYYAVAVGRTPGIYFFWDDCKKQVTGFPSAAYKGFETLEEANQFIEAIKGNTVTAPAKAEKVAASSPSASTSLTEPPVSTDTEAVAYVDGSFNNHNKTFSYGVVMFFQGEELHFSKKVTDDSLVSMRNVAGEICGSMAAMQFAVENHCTHLTIYHDYEGIAKWPLGLWKTNKEGTIAYKEYYDSIKDKLQVTFSKVKGHSNDKYNDLADELAKKAIF